MTAKITRRTAVAGLAAFAAFTAIITKRPTAGEAFNIERI